MKKLLALLLLIIIPAISFAGSRDYIDTDGLTPEQVNQLKIKALQLQNEAATPPQQKAEVVDQVNKWAEVGKNMGSALVSTAKEMGVAVNDFAKTDVGKMTTAIILYKLIGHDIIKLAVGSFLMVLLPVMLFFVYQSFIIQKVYEYQDRKFLGVVPWKAKIVTARKNRLTDGWMPWANFWYLASFAITEIAGLIIIFS